MNHSIKSVMSLVPGTFIKKMDGEHLAQVWKHCANSTEIRYVQSGNVFTVPSNTLVRVYDVVGDKIQPQWSIPVTVTVEIDERYYNDLQRWITSRGGKVC